MKKPPTLTHPFDRYNYTYQDGKGVEVIDPATGRSGIFNVKGEWVSGELRFVDAMMVRYAVDIAPGVLGLSPGTRTGR
jgi:hypothetical protein